MTGHEASCSYCGLPVATKQPPASGEKLYCCFGCRFASKVSQEDGADGQARWMLTRLGIAVFFSMNVMVFTMALWSRDVYDLPATGSDADLLHELFRYACLLFSLPVMFLLGGPLLDNALGDLRRGRLTTDLLILVGVTAALAYSAISVLRGTGQVYFEVACMVLVAVTLGRWLEAVAKLKTTDTLSSLENLLPQDVTALRDGQFDTVPLDDVAIGDFLRVLPGQRIATDGKIVRNRAYVDQQMITGESRPVSKEVGDEVLGGSLNLDGDITLEVTSPPHGGSLDRLVQAVKEAAESPSRHQRLADRVALAFIPLVAILAVGVLMFHTQRADLATGILAALSVLLIACPCALGLATPLAWWAALGRAARRGVLFRNGDALSRLASVRAACFDKTGTLTTGMAEVEHLTLAHGSELDQVQSAISSLSQTVEHWTSDAIARWDDRGDHQLATDSAALPGRGVEGRVAGINETVSLGSAELMNHRDLLFDTRTKQAVEKANAVGRPVSCVGWQGRVRGVLVFRDHVREDAAQAIDELKQIGLAVEVLTGDGEGQAAAISKLLDLPVRGKLLPEDKLAALDEIRRRSGFVAMVGDGVNDAPALAGADVGIALGCGADISRDSADVCILSNQLTQVPWAYGLARQTVVAVRQNLFWAFSYNTVGIGIAACGWLNPIFAAIAMVGSSLFVVTNSLRLAGGEDEMSKPLSNNNEAQTEPHGSESPADVVTAA
ncbi:MAG: cation-translocating P-type ATPase [Pirellulales bacterium]|nr:cation-translocating P-type ATPase [Pirellulales bacterium]